MSLTKTSHCKGWQKAKEQTASSHSSAHFGHYKAGMHSKLINAAHTALAAIPLKTGYMMLEKPPGNFEADKLWIILLFKVDFNQFNKHIGQEMMLHAEQYSLCGQTIWKPSWTKLHHAEHQ